MSKYLALVAAVALAAFFGLREREDYRRWNNAWDRDLADWYD